MATKESLLKQHQEYRKDMKGLPPNTTLWIKIREKDREVLKELGKMEKENPSKIDDIFNFTGNKTVKIRKCPQCNCKIGGTAVRLENHIKKVHEKT